MKTEQPELNWNKVLSATVIGIAVAIAIVVLLATSGCTVTRVAARDIGGGETKVTSYTIAWPWLDTAKSLDKAQLASGTNKTTVSLAGYTEAETMSTNAVSFMERGISAAVKTAVEAVKTAK